MTAEQIKKLAAAGLTVEQIAAVAEIMEPRGPRQATTAEVMQHIHTVNPPLHYPPGARGTAGGPSPDINDYGFRSEPQTER